jgi:O-methyltransferase
VNTAADILQKINPPESYSTFEEVEAMLKDKNCFTLCLRSTFAFAKTAIKKILAENIPGDIVIAGVWRGGLAAYIQALLVEHKLTNRKLHLADTYNGFFEVPENNPLDKKMSGYFSSLDAPTGSPEEIKQLFTSLQLPFDNVCILKGDVKTTTANFNRTISLLIIDVDFYVPTLNSLINLHEHVSENGFVYIDDYNVEVYECKKAVDRFIADNHLSVEITEVNKFAVYWRK